MSLKVRTEPQKTHQITIKGAKLTYRHLGHLDFSRLWRQFQKNGEIQVENQDRFALACMEGMVSDWTGVLDMDTDKPIKYKPEYLEGLEAQGIMKFYSKVLVPDLQKHGFVEPIKDKKDELGN